jgi:hypothetical protein
MPLPPAVPMDKMGITHVYHNADPIPMGVCTGVTSACYVAGIVGLFSGRLGSLTDRVVMQGPNGLRRFGSTTGN